MREDINKNIDHDFLFSRCISLGHNIADCQLRDFLIICCVVDMKNEHHNWI